MSTHGTVLTKGEQESRTTTTAGDKVTLHHVTQHKGGKMVVMDWTFDFTDISKTKLMELASRSLVIDQRNAWKKLGEHAATDSKQTKQEFLVSDLLSKQKRGKSTTEKVADLVKDMSPEDIAELLKSVS